MPRTRWGQAIQRLLVERGWTQKRLASAASVRPNTLTNIIKHGRHTDTATLTRIASALSVDLAELFVTEEQTDVLRTYRRDRVERVAERVLSELSTTVTRLVREDFERLLAEQSDEARLRPRPSRRRRSPRKTAS